MKYRVRNVIAVVGAALVTVTAAGAGQKDTKCQIDMVPTGVGTCIDMFEWSTPRGYPLLGVSALPEAEDKKRGIIMNAQELCASLGRRVCDRTEWVAACRGPNGSRYPWGNSKPILQKGEKYDCNADKRWIKPDETKIYLRDEDEMKRLDQSEYIGNRKKCVSASGAYDMIGNAEEWVTCRESPYGWCLVGRYWGSLWNCDQAVTTHAPRWHYYSTGFRCCADPE